MRDGKWKLVAKGANGPWELYDIDADRTELNNLAEKEPNHLRIWPTFGRSRLLTRKTLALG